MHKDAARIAAHQHGVISRAQLVACGLNPDAVDRRMRSGELVKLFRGVYAMPGTRDSFPRRITAAVLAVGGLAAASHRAAAALHGMGDLAGSLEVSVPSCQRPRLPCVRVYRVSFLPAEHVVARNGIRVTTPARTFVDLAAVLDVDALEVALDHELARNRIRLPSVLAVLDSMPPNTRGAGALRKIIAARPDGRARVESKLEKALHSLLERHGVGGWRPQRWIAGCRIDAVFAEEKLALQIDSYRHHSSRTDWALDHTRTSKLVEAGWRVLPVTAEDIQTGAALVARIQSARAAVTLDS